MAIMAMGGMVTDMAMVMVPDILMKKYNRTAYGINGSAGWMPEDGMVKIVKGKKYNENISYRRSRLHWI